MQLTLEFFQPAVEKEPAGNPGLPAKITLENYIKVCGLVAYKDFFMKIKKGLIAIPEGLTKEQYLTLAREVFESRAAKVNRNNDRSKFFAVKNAIKKRKEGRKC